MKRPLENANRWFRQAEHDLQMAKRFEEESPADACYFAEQAGQKALKAYLYRKGSRGEPEHSVRLLAQKCGSHDPSFLTNAQRWKLLDQFYIPTRYPDALADPAVPFESYSAAQAAEAVRLASEILEAVRARLNAAG